MRTLGESLTKHLPKELLAQYRFSFQVIDSPDVNAWAYPGGMIFITTSLIKQMKLSRDEIAAVLGHEIGHVVSRHSQKEIIKQNVMSWIVSAFIREVCALCTFALCVHLRIDSFVDDVICLNLFFAKQDNDGVKETFGENIHEMLVEGAQRMTALAFSRKDEYEADDRGVSYLQSAGLSPHGMISFFDKLLSLEKKGAAAEGGGGAIDHMSWFSTHPGTADRIAVLKERFGAGAGAGAAQTAGGSAKKARGR